MNNVAKYIDALREGFKKMTELSLHESVIYTVGAKGPLTPPGQTTVISTTNVRLSRVILEGKDHIKIECLEAPQTFFLPAGTEKETKDALMWLNENVNIPYLRHMRKLFVLAQVVNF